MFHVDCPLSRLRVCRCPHQEAICGRPARPSPQAFAVWDKYAELIRKREEEDAAAPAVFPFRDRKKRRVENAAPRLPMMAPRTATHSHASGPSHSDVQFTASGRVSKPPEEVARNREAAQGRTSIAESMIRRPRRAAALAAEKGRRALQEEEESLAQEEEEERKKIQVLNAAQAQASAQASYLAQQQQHQHGGAVGVPGYPGGPGAVPGLGARPGFVGAASIPLPGQPQMGYPGAYGSTYPGVPGAVPGGAPPGAYNAYAGMAPRHPAATLPPRTSLPASGSPEPAPQTPSHLHAPADPDFSPSAQLRGGPAAKRNNVSNIKEAPEGKGQVKYKYQCELCQVWLFPSGWGQHIKFCAARLKKKDPNWVMPQHLADMTARIPGGGGPPQGVNVAVMTAQDLAPGGDLSGQSEWAEGEPYPGAWGGHAGDA
eukprot:tig00001127_g7139.t1